MKMKKFVSLVLALCLALSLCACGAKKEAAPLKIATKPKVPIVVCTIQNTDKVTTNIKKLKPTDIYVHIVGVITPEDYAGMTTVALGQQVYQMMLDDLGPDYAPLQSENA